jgi:ribose/xylose/arabinose/galactoside ABC-type transport system permease subunit
METTVPPTASCSAHQDVPATAVCQRCGRAVCEICSFPGLVCPDCMFDEPADGSSSRHIHPYAGPLTALAVAMLVGVSVALTSAVGTSLGSTCSVVRPIVIALATLVVLLGWAFWLRRRYLSKESGEWFLFSIGIALPGSLWLAFLQSANPLITCSRSGPMWQWPIVKL